MAVNFEDPSSRKLCRGLVADGTAGQDDPDGRNIYLDELNGGWTDELLEARTVAEVEQDDAENDELVEKILQSPN